MAEEERERLLIRDVAVKTGLPKRTVQQMAKRGDIPGAAKLGNVWTFDRWQLTRWIEDAERRDAPRTHRGSARAPRKNSFIQKVRNREIGPR